MDGGSQHCTGGHDQDHPQEREMQKGKMVVWGGLTNSWEEKRSERQRRKGKIDPSVCRVPKNSKERWETLSQWSMQSENEVKSLSHVRLFATPWTIAYQDPPSMGFSRQSAGVDCHFLLQGIFPTQELNPGLPHCRQTLYRLSHQGSKMLGWLKHKLESRLPGEISVTEDFLISPCYSLELCTQMDISFLFSFSFCFSFSPLFVRPPQTTIFPFCVSFCWGGFWLLPPVQCYEPPSVVLQHCLSDLILWIYLSLCIIVEKKRSEKQRRKGKI